MKKCKGLLSEIRDLIRSVTKNSVDYDEKYLKIKFNLDDDLSLKLLGLFFMKKTNIVDMFS